VLWKESLKRERKAKMQFENQHFLPEGGIFIVDTGMEDVIRVC
jgi:hypothetical protein